MMRRLAMSLLQAPEEISRDAGEPNPLHPPVIARFLAHDEAGADEVVNESARRRPGSADSSSNLTDRGFFAVGHVVHRDELRESQLAPSKLVQSGEEKIGREPR
jgi:hypothetical protein